MTLTARTLGAAAALAAAAIALTGCVAKATADPAASFTVKSTADACTVSGDTAKSGTLTFDISNSGDQVTEFYLLASDGLRIVGEVENIAPSASRTMTVVAQPGDYFTVCKPGMVGDGVGKSAFTVSGGRSTTKALLDTCFRQVEYAGVLRGADNPAGAKALVDWLLTAAVQKALPGSMYVYPVAKGTALPADWSR